MVNVHQGGQFHVHAGKLHGQRIEPLFRASIGEVLHDAVFRTDDELFGIGLFCISHNACGRANIISLLHDLGAAFGMNQKQRLRVGSAGFGYICCRTYDMARAAAVVKGKLLFRQLLCYIAAQIGIWDEQNLIVFQRTANFQRAGGRHTDIAGRFQLRSCIDVRHNGVAWVLLFQFLQGRQIKLLGHRAARHGVGQPDGFLRA